MVRRIGRLGRLVVEVRATQTPWAEGYNDGVIVVPSGYRGSLRGQLARFWRESLGEGTEVLRYIEEQIRTISWVEPARPAWMKVAVLENGGKLESNVCVATAFDRHGPHPENARRAAAAIVAEAARRGIRHLALPLLGAGAGGLEAESVAVQELDGIAYAQSCNLAGGVEKVSFLVEEYQVEAIAAMLSSILAGRAGITKWYDLLKEKGRFSRIRVLEQLEGGYSGACLDVCEVWDERDNRLPLAVFKIGPSQAIDQEAVRAKRAIELLQEYGVEVRDVYVLEPEVSALRMPLVRDQGLGSAGMSYLRFFEASGDPHEVARAAELLFGRATKLLYSESQTQWMKLIDLREAMERTRGGQYWSQASAGLMRLLYLADADTVEKQARITLKGLLDNTIDNPFSRHAPIHAAWEIFVEVPTARLTHGDLNPRNVVMVKLRGHAEYTPRILDFNRFGEPGPLALDFARFEAGIHVKCLEAQIRYSGDPARVRALLNYQAVVSDFMPPHTESLIGLVSPEFTKAVFSVAAIRKCYSQYTKIEDARSYWFCLFLSLISYLRPVYDARLSDEQRLFALHLAAGILERHVLPRS